VKKGNILHANYIIFSELIGLLSRENPDKEINKKKVITFLKKNRIKSKDINRIFLDTSQEKSITSKRIAQAILKALKIARE